MGEHSCTHTLHVVRLLPFVMLINAYWQMLRRSRACREQLSAEDRTLSLLFSAEKHSALLRTIHLSPVLLKSPHTWLCTPGVLCLSSFSSSPFLLSLLSALPSQFILHIFTRPPPPPPPDYCSRSNCLPSLSANPPSYPLSTPSFPFSPFNRLKSPSSTVRLSSYQSTRVLSFLLFFPSGALLLCA